MPSIHSDALWSAIKRLADVSRSKVAAVAYVTDDEIVKFGEDDLLVVDASNQAIGAGQTSHGVLQRAFDRGANLFCCPGLHAKIIAFDDAVVVGSANLSRSSRDDLIEAGMITKNRQSVADAKMFVERLAEQCDQIDKAFLDRIKRIKVAKRKPVSKRMPGVTTGKPEQGKDYYVNFGQKTSKSQGIRRDWGDARRYGFVSGGGKPRNVKSMQRLSPGDRIFVYIKQCGYVGIGVVTELACRVKDFIVEVNGQEVPLSDAPLKAKAMLWYEDDPEIADRVVRVQWLKTYSEDQAFNGPDLFYNQNLVCSLNDETEQRKFTKQRVLEHFGLDQ